MEPIMNTCCGLSFKNTSYISAIYTVVISIYYMATNIAMLVGGLNLVYWYPQHFIVIVINITDSLALLVMTALLFLGTQKSNANLILSWVMYCWMYILCTFVTLPIGFIVIAVNAGTHIIYPSVVWVAVSISLLLQLTLILCTCWVYTYTKILKSGNVNHQIMLAPVGQAYGSNYIDPSGNQMIMQPYNQGFPPGGQAFGPNYNQFAENQMIQQPYQPGFQPGVQAYGPNYNYHPGNQMMEKPYPNAPPSTNQAYEPEDYYPTGKS